jgi:hypothetical protein
MPSYKYFGPEQLIMNTFTAGLKGQQYAQTDTPEAHQKFRNSSDYDSIYDTLEISYDYNSLGYRTKEISELDKEFFLVFGCSYSEGTGLAVQHRWGDVLSDLLSMDYLNLAQSGTGLQVSLANTFLYMHNKLPLPKFVIYQHSEIVRVIDAELNPDHVNLETWSPEGRNLMQEMDIALVDKQDCTSHFRSGMYTNALTQLWNSLGVPVIHWTYTEDGPNKLSAFEVLEYPADMQWSHPPVCDLARDGQHNGIKCNRIVAENLEIYVRQLLESGELNMPATRTLYGSSKLEKMKAKIMASRRNDPFIYK